MFTPDTSRVAYRSTKLADEQVRDLQAANTLEGVTLRIFQNQADLERFSRFAVAGTEIENDLAAPVALAGKLFRPNEYQKNKYRYGFSLEGNGTAGPVMYFVEALLTVAPSMNSPEAARKTTVDQTGLEVANTPAYALIITRDNTRRAQVEAGMLYSRFQLAALTMGFAMQPMSQVLEEFPEMREPYQAIHRAYASDGGTTQMLARVGMPVRQVPRSMRRGVEEILMNGAPR
jgi:hypothetical protein